MRIDLSGGFYLSPVQNGDQAALIEHFSDKETTDLLLKVPYPHTEKDADFWVQLCLETLRKEPQPRQFALRRADGFMVGGIGLVLHTGSAAHRGETGYWVAKNYRGRGLATDAVRGITHYAFEHFDLWRIEATPFAHNPSSHRVLEKAGYLREGLMKAFHLKNGIPIDAWMFAITKG